MNPLLLIDQCYNRLPVEMKEKPWEATDHGRRILQTEDELNAYIAAYGEMHIVKCRAAMQNFPFEDIRSYHFEIFDWGCGQGLATLTLLDMLEERHMLPNLRKIYLIEPSNPALQRAERWIRQCSLPIEIISVNRSIPNNVGDLMPEVSCSSTISINLFSNILDIRGLSLSWLANKVSSLANVNYNICVGPKFMQGTNTRINDFCGYFSPQEYFSDINKYPYGYTTRTHHAYGCETKCFIHRRDQPVNSAYIERADPEIYYDPYGYSTEILRGIIEDDVLNFYTRLRQECAKSYDIYIQPAINCDTIDFLLVSKSKGIILINVCRNLEDLEACYNRVRTVKENLFNIHLRTIKIDSVLHRNIYGNVKTGLFFPTASSEDIQSKIDEINEEKKASQDDDSKTRNTDCFAYLIALTQESNLQESIGRLRSNGFKYDYYEEMTNLISSSWHSYKEGDIHFRLTQRQKDIVISSSPRLRIKGVAGCGKTQVVANRAIKQHLRTGDRVLIITFNISLIQYIRMRINQVPADFAPSMFEITNYHEFFKSKANLYSQSRIYLEDFDNPNYFNSYRNEIKKYRTIIIDEVQDFKEAWIQSICTNFLEEGGTLSLFGDGEQNIYDRELESDTKMPPIRGCGFIGRWSEMNETESRLSMRTQNPQIASLASGFAREFISNDVRNIEIQQEFNFDETLYVKYWKPNNPQTAETICANIRWIFETYHIAPEECAILAQSINILRDIEDAYTRITNRPTMINFETKSQYEKVTHNNSPMYIKKDLDEIRRAAKTHFSTSQPCLKLSTIHSFKGWESNSIILILQPEVELNDNIEGYQIHKRENTPALIYTAITRAKRNLFIINLGNPSYHEFFHSNLQQ